MKARHGLLLALALVVAACGDDSRLTGPPASTTRSTAPTFGKISSPGIDITDRYIVVLKKDVGNPDVVTDELLRANGGAVQFRYRAALKGFAATFSPQAIDAIRHDPNVDYVEPDAIATVFGTQSNPPSWGLDRVDQRTKVLDQTYNYPNDATDVKVYIIDTGIRFDHQEFGGRAISGWDFVDNDPDASDCYGHGTHVAGTVGGITVGIAKNVTLVAVRVLNCQGSGTYSQVIAGVDWVTANHTGPSVANMSLGGPYSAALNQAVANSVASGVTYAVAAGNSSAPACNYSPASEPSAITVGASDINDVGASFTNYGTCVDIFAPGVNITSSTMTTTSSYATWSGTSMATPHVAGVAALYLYANPTATPSQVTTAILNDATANALTSIGTGSPNLLVHNFWVSAPGPGVPAAPSNLTATATSPTAIGLQWTDNSSNEDGFTIERASSSGGPFALLASVGPNTTTFSNSGLPQGTSFWYRVYATNAAGSSGYSNTATATTLRQVHVAALSTSATSSNGGWYGRLTVTVRNASSVLQPGVTVMVSWGGGSGSAVTNSSGQCTVSTNRMKNSVSSVTMSVSNLSGTGFVYDSSSNTPNPPSATVSRP